MDLRNDPRVIYRRRTRSDPYVPKIEVTSLVDILELLGREKEPNHMPARPLEGVSTDLLAAMIQSAIAVEVTVSTHSYLLPSQAARLRLAVEDELQVRRQQLAQTENGRWTLVPCEHDFASEQAVSVEPEPSQTPEPNQASTYVPRIGFLDMDSPFLGSLSEKQIYRQLAAILHSAGGEVRVPVHLLVEDHWSISRERDLVNDIDIWRGKVGQ